VSRQIKTIVGENLCSARRAQGMTQRDLAKVIDTDAAQVSRWERGAVRPNDTTLARLAEALNVEFAWFFIEHARAKAA
jgi:transcriptional regulator with XRE-family HTH domain